jgi:subtilisin-like proprotein convertase family protein
VALNSLTHTYVEDVFVLLNAPNGERTTLMTYTYPGPVSGINLTFDDAASNIVPFSGSIPSGTYLPTDYYYYRTNGGPYSLPPPAPPWPYNATLAPLVSTPNGTWSLYLYDFATPDIGTLASWSLRFVTLQTNYVCCSTLPDPTFPTYTSTTWSNGVVRLSWAAVPGPNYQVQFRTNLTAGSWQNLGGLIPGTNSILGITDSVPGVPTRFYRVLVSP